MILVGLGERDFGMRMKAFVGGFQAKRHGADKPSRIRLIISHSRASLMTDRERQIKTLFYWFPKPGQAGQSLESLPVSTECFPQAIYLKISKKQDSHAPMQGILPLDNKVCFLRCRRP